MAPFFDDARGIAECRLGTLVKSVATVEGGFEVTVDRETREGMLSAPFDRTVSC
jgi:hypothetical protein